ncbi:uncharacterized protein [Blastocystis hominis]|uniref:Small nuclear ribonucleoprotein Sm D3 n=1 Tax=Blastocystis hominis TaxID=12968 RepID=D8M578_BLAHO|nr:uncharacterized protein [Blastocystis hominis]CBK23217.2 unnamed protein product [Blastocystis hominis]|eukprot:XP_012897265.1 uncharacterized protein [Blastocystis hominis]
MCHCLAMSVSGKRIIGMPTLLLYEAEGCTALIQTRDGSIYRGIIMEVQDNWNLNMKNVTMKTKYSNEIIPFEMLFIRGAQISFIVLPEMFKHSPMFQRVIDFKNDRPCYSKRGSSLYFLDMLAYS